jgi:hypothetical protein
MCPLDAAQPSDDLDIPAFPGYLRGVWTNNILPAYVPCQFTLWKAGLVQAGTNVGQEIVISATPSLPILVLQVQGRVKVPSISGDIGVSVLINGISMLGGPLIIPAGLLTSTPVVPNTTTLHNSDVLSIGVTASGNSASDLSVHLLCQARVTYP